MVLHNNQNYRYTLAYDLRLYRKRSGHKHLDKDPHTFDWHKPGSGNILGLSYIQACIQCMDFQIGQVDKYKQLHCYVPCTEHLNHKGMGCMDQ